MTPAHQCGDVAAHGNVHAKKLKAEKLESTEDAPTDVGAGYTNDQAGEPAKMAEWNTRSGSKYGRKAE